MIGLKNSYNIRRLVPGNMGVRGRAFRSGDRRPLFNSISRISQLIIDLFGVSDLPLKVAELHEKITEILVRAGDRPPSAEDQQRLEAEFDRLSAPGVVSEGDTFGR